VLILPAIDLRGGQCVRLRQGDFTQETVFGSDPVAIARRWVDQGAAYLHIVDLDGAREGRPINGDCVRRMVAAAGVPCQLGGGIRNNDDIAQALDVGVDRVVVGTRAESDPAWLERATRHFPGKILLGVDARDGRVAVNGWTEQSPRSPLELARRCDSWPLAAVVYTDISRDGMLEGPNLEAFEELVSAVKLPIIASGGVTSAEDVHRLKAVGVAGCIIGRALYEGRLHLSEIIAKGP